MDPLRRTFSCEQELIQRLQCHPPLTERPLIDCRRDCAGADARDQLWKEIGGDDGEAGKLLLVLGRV
jgi:hypothetical protein